MSEKEIEVINAIQDTSGETTTLGVLGKFNCYAHGQLLATMYHGGVRLRSGEHVLICKQCYKNWEATP